MSDIIMFGTTYYGENLKTSKIIEGGENRVFSQTTDTDKNV